MERKLILFEEMGVKSVPDCGYSGRCYKMLLASIKLRVTRVKKKKTDPQKTAFISCWACARCVQNCFFSLKKYIHVYICFSSHILWYTYMYGQRYIHVRTVFPLVCVVFQALNSTFPGHNPTLVRHPAPPVFHATTKIHILQHHSSQFIQMHMYIMYRPYTEVGGLAS